MGTKQRDIAAHLESECQGFVYDTARSFLRKHSNPTSLLSQLKGLYHQGQNQACKDLIQLIFEQGHSLSENSEVMLLQAQISFEQQEDSKETNSWIKQAELTNKKCESTKTYRQVIEAQTLLKEGVYEQGEKQLIALLDSEYGAHAAYSLAYHFFWRGRSTQKAIDLLEMAVKERPSFTKAWATLGFAYNKMGLKEKAQHSFSQCLQHETNPEKLAFYKQQLAS